MIPFDGIFAQGTILPLAAAAYDPTWNIGNNAVLATFTQVHEILVDTTDVDFQKMAGRPQMSANSHSALLSMRTPKGAGVAPDVTEVLHAEGDTAAPPDTDVPAMAPAAAASVPVVLAVSAVVPVNDRFGWVCRDGTRLIITFRGTQTPGDWMHNFDFVPEPYQPIPGRGTVHQGFQLVYYAIRKNLLALVNAVGEGCTEVIITGHSLGGGLATLAMPDILNVLPSTVSPVLYNVASPRVGHADFQKLFDAHVNVCYRIVNVWDVVPHVPPALAGYVHVGNQLMIDSSFSLDIVHNHGLSTGYAPGLASWNANHAVVKTPNMGTYAISSLVGVSA